MGQHKNVYNVYKRSADSGEGRNIFNTSSGFVIDTSSKLLAATEGRSEVKGVLNCVKV